MRKRKNPLTGQVEDYPAPKTYLCPESGRPDRESVSAALGFTVPASFVDLVEWIYDQAKGDPYRSVDVFYERVGLGVADDFFRYDSTPCEFFPFGDTCVDGDHYGYLVHAPELQADDYPVCHYCPMDSDGVIIAGVGTYDGIASIMSLWAKSEAHPDGPGWAAAFQELGSKRRKEIDVQKAIHMPNGWRYQASSDGVGVLAPESFFESEEVVTLDPSWPVERYLGPAADAVGRGHVATALYYLREGYWNNWTEHPVPLCELMCDVYERLDRGCLADTLRARMTKWKESSGSS
jgi:hypothetical protein